MIERIRGHMQEFVGEPIAEGFEYLVRILAFGEEFFGALQLMAPALFSLFAQRPNRGNNLARFEPVHEVDDIRIDNGLRLGNRPLTRIQPFLDDLGQIIDRIKKDVIEFRNLRLYVPRHGQIDHEDGAMLANLDGAFQHALAQYRKRAGSAGHHDIVQSQLFGKLVQCDDVPVESMSEYLRALDGSVGNRHAFGVSGGKMAGAQLDHFSRADEQYILLIDIAEYPLR